MKKVIIIKKGMPFFAAILFACILQAQSWQNFKSLTAYGMQTTNDYAQKIRPFKEDMLVAIIKQNNNYGFSLWIDGSNSVTNKFFASQNIIVSDMCILGDTLYFCGKRLITQNNYIGIIGRLNMQDFINNPAFQYETADITNTEHLTHLVAYNKPYSNVVFIVAIGNNGLSNNQTGRYVFVYYDPDNSSTASYTCSCPFISSNKKEIFEDICLTDNHVATISRIYPDSEFIIRTFELANPTNNQYKNSFSFPNTLYFNTSFVISEFPLHITHLGNDKVAVCVSVSYQSNYYYTMVNKLGVTSNNISSTQLVPYDEKANKPLELDYLAETNQLLLLNSCYLQGTGRITQTITVLNPDTIPPYNATMEFFDSTGYEFKHLSVIPNSRYAAIGTYQYQNQNQYNQLVSTKYFNYNGSCMEFHAVSIGTINNTPQATSAGNLTSSPNPTTITWTTGNIGGNPFGITTNCVE